MSIGCGVLRDTFNMTMHLSKDRTHTTATMTTTSATESGHTTRAENVGHKLYLENDLSSPDLFDIFTY
jgi:hypothetical protein